MNIEDLIKEVKKIEAKVISLFHGGKKYKKQFVELEI